MRILFVAGLACAAFALVQCIPRQYNQSETKSAEDVVFQGSKPPQVVTLVNYPPFNAFNIWRDGQGSEILDYPQGYDVASGATTPNGVFYVEREAYWKDGKFIGVPTEGAKVVNDVLEYPLKNGKQLKLKFTKVSEKMKHLGAVAYCKNQGLRLPTVREIFDFCAAGVTEPNYGPNFERDKYPSTARCGQTWPWSASVFSDFRFTAWSFDGEDGNVYDDAYRSNTGGGVWCVGGG